MKRQLFVLYVWPEEMEQQQLEWRGRIKHLDSGEVRYFRDPATLYQALLHMLHVAQREDEFSKGKPDLLDAPTG